MAPRLRKALRAALLTAAIVEALYVIPANVVLNTPLVGRLTNRRPEKFHIGWRFAITPWPGLVHLRGIETGGRSRAILWQARLTAVTARFALWPLRERVVHLKSVRAAGIEYAQRPRLEPGEAPPEEAAQWAAIGGASDPPGQTDAVRGRAQPWTVRADRIRGRVRQIWIGRYRLAGPARVDAAMDLVVRGPLELPRIDYLLESGNLWVGEQKMFERLRLEARARLAPFVPRGRKAVEVIRALSGQFDLDARDGSLRFLEVYFRKAPGLRLNGGGPMRMRLLLDSGRLLTGSRIERSEDRIDTTFLGTRFVGTGTLAADVQAVDGVPTSRIEAVTANLQVTQVGRDEPHARGRDLRLVATSTNLDLTDPFADVHIVIDLPEAVITDLSVYNRYLPPESRMKILSGAGRLRYHFEGDSNERSLHGEMAFDMENLGLKFEDVRLAGDVRILTRLRRGEPREKRFDIAGTRITLLHRAPPWRGSISFPEAMLTFSEPMQVDARVRLDLQDTRPIVEVFDAYKDVSRFVERLMTIENLRGGAGFRIEEDRVEIRNLNVEGKGLRALADLSLGRSGREGILYLRFHGISLGVALEGGEKDLRLFRPRAWFDRKQAERRSRRTARAAEESGP